jgi:methionine-rich copper-binding protein CopC
MRTISLFMLAMLSAASPAFAHAMLERASPLVGSEVPAPPHEIILTFTEGVEPLFSTIELRDAHGAAVVTDKPRTDKGNNRRLVVELPALGSGTYTVTWHATSVDTHKTEGSYQFIVK